MRTACKINAELTAKADVTIRGNGMAKENYYLNGEGYRDPTAYPCIEKENRLEKRVNALIKAIKTIIALSGFELINRIELRDKHSGEEFK